MIIIIYPVHWLILYLFGSVCSFFSFALLLLVFSSPFYKKRFLYMIVIWSLSSIQYIDWFFTLILLYVTFFYLNYFGKWRINQWTGYIIIIVSQSFKETIALKTNTNITATIMQMKKTNRQIQTSKESIIELELDSDHFTNQQTNIFPGRIKILHDVFIDTYPAQNLIKRWKDIQFESQQNTKEII